MSEQQSDERPTEQADEQPRDELKNMSYELFIAALSVLSIVNLVMITFIANSDVVDVVAVMDGFLSLIFLGDFFYRFFSSSSKKTYFLRQFGWADLLASLPFPQAKLLRLFRIFRAGRLINTIGPKNLLREFAANRGGSALLTVLLLMVLTVEFGALGMLAVESRSPDANIKNASDALWYMWVTITTVGYGDRYPVTNSGRLIGVLVLTTGVGLFGTLTGFLANAFVAPKS